MDNFVNSFKNTFHWSMTAAQVVTTLHCLVLTTLHFLFNQKNLQDILATKEGNSSNTRWSTLCLGIVHAAFSESEP